MEDGLKKHILDTFSMQLLQNFQQHCETQGFKPKIETFMTYIVDRGLISPTAVQRYAILKTFEELNSNQTLTKTELVDLLADRFSLTSRSIWNLLRTKRLVKK